MNFYRFSLIGSCCLALLLASNAQAGQSNNDREARRRQARVQVQRYQRYIQRNKQDIQGLERQVKQAQAEVKKGPAAIKTSQSKLNKADAEVKSKKDKVDKTRRKVTEKTLAATEARKKLVTEFETSPTIKKLNLSIADLKVKIENLELDLLEPLKKTGGYKTISQEMDTAQKTKSRLFNDVNPDRDRVQEVAQRILDLQTRMVKLIRSVLEKDPDYVEIEKQLKKLQKELQELRVVFNRILLDHPDLSGITKEARDVRIALFEASKAMGLANRSLSSAKSGLRKSQIRLAAAKSAVSSLQRQKSNVESLMKRNQQQLSKWQRAAR